MEREVRLKLEKAVLAGTLTLPERARGLVLFAHGSGSSRHSPRNRYVAGVLNEAGLGTLLFDLLTADEDMLDRRTRALRFDIPLLAERLEGATRWTVTQPELRELPLGYFGASTGAAAALVAAANLPDDIRAVVSRGGRPDLAGEALRRVTAPTLLIVGSQDHGVLGLNEKALAELADVDKELEVIPGATHLFEEPGTLELAARVARDWLVRHLAARDSITGRRPRSMTHPSRRQGSAL